MPDPLDRAALDDLLAMVGGETDLFVEMLDTFATDAVGYAAELDAALASADVTALVRPAHSLKSNAMNVGATRLADLCRALESDARAAGVGLPDAAARVAAVHDELARVRDAVSAARREAIDGA